MNAISEAVCVAVVGPANAGKSTLLYQLDERLKKKLDCFMVVKGQPDGTGMFFYHASELRHDPEFKKTIKGKWGEATIDRICEWIICGRRNLSLVLLDLGGRHDEKTAKGNEQMLRCCSHYLIVSRMDDDAGGKYWDDVCSGYGLTRLGWMHSMTGNSQEPPGLISSNIEVQATFHVDVVPGNRVNDVVLEPLVTSLLQLSRPLDQVPYVNLWQHERWDPAQLPTVGGRDRKIAQLALRTGVVVLGGAAPVWAYLAGVSCALAANSDVRVFIFDPKQPECLVEIPPRSPRPDMPSAFPPDVFRISWRDDRERSVLQFDILTEDKILPPSAAENLVGAPRPLSLPSTHIGLFGKAPMWFFGAYARWLIEAGIQSLDSWDVGTQRFVPIPLVYTV